MNPIEDGEKSYVNYKNLIFGIKSCCYQLFLSNKLYPLGNEKSFNNSIQPWTKLLIIEIDLDIASGKERHSISNIFINISQFKSFFKETVLFIFVIYWKQDNNHLICLTFIAIEFSSTHVGLLILKAWFLYKTWFYCVDLATWVNKHLNKNLAKTSGVIDTENILEILFFCSFEVCFLTSLTH